MMPTLWMEMIMCDVEPGTQKDINAAQAEKAITLEEQADSVEAGSVIKTETYTVKGTACRNKTTEETSSTNVMVRPINSDVVLALTETLTDANDKDVSTTESDSILFYSCTHLRIKDRCWKL